MEIAGGQRDSDDQPPRDEGEDQRKADSSSEQESSEEQEQQRADPTRTKLTGQGLNGGHAGSDLSFLIHAHDSSGTKCQQGGDDVVVRLVPSSQSMQLTGPINVSVTDNENGVYSTSYRVPDKGSYMLHVEINYLPITGSPFPLFIGPPMTAAEAAEASAAAAKAPPSSAAQATLLSANAPVRSSDDPTARTVYVSGLSTLVSLDHYRQLLAIQGRIKSIKMVGTDLTTGVLIVEFSLPAGADAALKMSGMIVGMRPLLVQSTALYLMHQNAIANAVKATTSSLQGAATSLKVQKMNAMESEEAAARRGEDRPKLASRRSRSRSRDRRGDEDRHRPRERSRERDRHRPSGSRSRSRERMGRYRDPRDSRDRFRDERQYQGPRDRDRHASGLDRDRERYRDRSRSRSRERRGRDVAPEERGERKKDKKDKKDKKEKRGKDDKGRGEKDKKDKEEQVDKDKGEQVDQDKGEKIDQDKEEQVDQDKGEQDDQEGAGR